MSDIKTHISEINAIISKLNMIQPMDIITIPTLTNSTLTNPNLTNINMVPIEEQDPHISISLMDLNNEISTHLPKKIEY